MMHHYMCTPNFLANRRSVSTTTTGFNFVEVSKKGTKNVLGGPVDGCVVKEVAQRPKGCQFDMRAQNFWLKSKY